MFTIKTYIKTDKGVKVFTKKFVSKGSVIWEFIEGLDNKVLSEDIRELSLIQRDFAYMYFLKRDNLFYSCCDTSMFINHSLEPNCCFKEDVIISLRDISPGEELTIDFSL